VSRGAGIAFGLATALVIVAISILPFLSRPWMSFEQGRAQVTLWTGWPQADVRAATDSIVGDLIGFGGFDGSVQGAPILSERERSHMRDVRTVFAGFYVLAIVAAAGLWLAIRRRGAAAWAAIRGGAIGLLFGLVVAGAVLAFAFDAAFAIFHALFFASGSWTFDPATDRLVQLFPDQFWFETTAAVGALALVIGLGVMRLAGARKG
jgi:integral membrane protein (TIGR01906 family)